MPWDFLLNGNWHIYALVIGMYAWAVARVVIFFVVARFVAYRLINRALKSIIERDSAGASTARLRTLGGLIRSVIFYVLIFISVGMLLTVFDIDPKAFLTAAGVVGLAIGFGAQRLVKDVISGFFMVLEDQYSVGDYVSIGTVTGTVVELGMRITRLRDDVGKLVIIPNGDVSQVTNHSRGPLQATVDINVAPKSDPASVRAALNKAGEDVLVKVEGVLSPPKADGIIAVDSVKMTIRVTGEVKPGRQYAVETALREAVRERLLEAGIELAPSV